jgi:hypothetical protein
MDFEKIDAQLTPAQAKIRDRYARALDMVRDTVGAKREDGCTHCQGKATELSLAMLATWRDFSIEACGASQDTHSDFGPIISAISVLHVIAAATAKADLGSGAPEAFSHGMKKVNELSWLMQTRLTAGLSIL